MSRRIPSLLLSALMTLVCIVPFLYIFLRSFFASGVISFEGYYQVFLAQFQYLERFWRTLAMCLIIAAGQLIASTLAGYGFARCRFPGRDVIFFLLMLLMIMPLQVTLVPNYLMLDRLNLLDIYAALVLPMIFMPLGTFIMRQCFRAVSGSVIEAAHLDGCGVMGVILRVAAPMNLSGLVCTALLSFLDGWNMVEQPIVFLKDFAMYPIAVGLASAPPGDTTIQLVCCVLVVLPPLFLFSCFKKELVEGIAIGGEK